MTRPAPTTGCATPSSGARTCPVCGTGFRTDPRNPARTYCSHRCRNTAWRARRATPDGVTSDGTGHAAVNALDTRTTPIGRAATPVPDTGGRDDHGGRDRAATVQLCPHCRAPVVLVTLITTPAAAHVTVPDPPTTRGHQPRPL